MLVSLRLLRWSLLKTRGASTAITGMNASPSSARHSSSAGGAGPGTPTPRAFPLNGEAPRQFLTSDGETIVCIHPSSSVDISATKPLHPCKPQMESRRTKLDPNEVEHVQKLRSEDPDTWSVATLARLFNVKKIAISKVTRTEESRREELENERKLVSRMKPYKRKLYVLEREAKRQKRLQQALAQSDYKFPGNSP